MKQWRWWSHLRTLAKSLLFSLMANPNLAVNHRRPQKDKGKIQFSLLSFFGMISSNCWLKLENKTKPHSQNRWPLPLQTQLGERNVFACLLFL